MTKLSDLRTDLNQRERQGFAKFSRDLSECYNELALALEREDDGESLILLVKASLTSEALGPLKIIFKGAIEVLQLSDKLEEKFEVK